MSPELLLSKGSEATPKSDLWAMSATICELMARAPPHVLMTRAELEVEYSKQPWPPRPQMPAVALDHCKKKCLQLIWMKVKCKKVQM
jgi:serine/threonine protein kinase